MIPFITENLNRPLMKKFLDFYKKAHKDVQQALLLFGIVYAALLVGAIVVIIFNPANLRLPTAICLTLLILLIWYIWPFRGLRKPSR